MATEPADIRLRRPTVDDGTSIWLLAHGAGELDVNSSYAYLLWCRDFAATSVVADAGSELAGFITGYVRPDDTDVLLVWQVAVSDRFRRRGVASSMLDHLVSEMRDRRVGFLETTVTPGNEPSRAMFEALARRHGTVLEVQPLFATEDFPDTHEPEHLLRVGPFDRPATGVVVHGPDSR